MLLVHSVVARMRALGRAEYVHLSIRIHLGLLPTGRLMPEPPRSGHWLP